jgi:hypothetical protein
MRICYAKVINFVTSMNVVLIKTWAKINSRVINSRRMRVVGHVARMGDVRNESKKFVGKPKGKRPLGRPRRGGKIILGWILWK